MNKAQNPYPKNTIKPKQNSKWNIAENKQHYIIQQNKGHKIQFKT